MEEGQVYITIHSCPEHIRKSAQLWKPLLGKNINEILIMMLQRGLEEMTPEVMQKLKDM